MSDDVPRLQLPARKPAKALLAAHPDFCSALLDELWDMDKEDALPRNLSAFLRDWTAVAYFANSPVVQERLDELKTRIVGAVPRRIRSVRAVNRAFAPARRELQSLIASAVERKRVADSLAKESS